MKPLLIALLCLGCQAPPPKPPVPTKAEVLQSHLPPNAILGRQVAPLWWEATWNGKAYLIQVHMYQHAAHTKPLLVGDMKFTEVPK